MRKKHLIISGLATILILATALFVTSSMAQGIPDWLVAKNAASSKHDNALKDAEERSKNYKDSERPKIDQKILKAIEDDYPGFPGPYEIKEITMPSDEVPLDSSTANTINFKTRGMTPYNWVFTGSLVENPNEGIVYVVYIRPKTNERQSYFIHIPETGQITLTGISADNKTLTFKTETGKSGTLDISNGKGKYKIN
jgi:hypothetical protein